MANQNIKQVVTKVNKQISSLKRQKSFITWHAVSELSYKLHELLDLIDNSIVAFEPFIALQMLEKLFGIDKSIFERVDDSNGEIGTFYYCVNELWGKACRNLIGVDTDVLVKKIYDLILNNDYGSKDYLIEKSAPALRKKGLESLEQLLYLNKDSFNDYSLPYFLKSIADAQGDVDKYINLIQKHSNINELTVNNIAERLINKGRYKEAIKWLLHHSSSINDTDNILEFSPKKVTDSTNYHLLLQSYELENMLEQAQSLRWHLFTKTLSIQYFNGLIEHDNNLKQIELKAFDFVFNNYNGRLKNLLVFLKDIKKYEELNKLIIDKRSSLDGSDYSFYRSLSKILATSGYPLSACILRRELIDSLLAKAISKYYPYAVSDYKKALNFGEMVEDWQGLKNNQEYLEELKSGHFRKKAFWSRMQDANLI